MEATNGGEVRGVNLMLLGEVEQAVSNFIALIEDHGPGLPRLGRQQSCMHGMSLLRGTSLFSL